MINTAKLHEVLTIQQLSITGSTYDYSDKEWATVCVIKGSIIKNKGMLVDKPYGEFYKDLIYMYCRYSSLPKKGMRVLWNGGTYKISWLDISPHVPKNITIGLELNT